MSPRNSTNDFDGRSNPDSKTRRASAPFSGSTVLGAATNSASSDDDTNDFEQGAPLSFDDSDIHEYGDDETQSLYAVCSRESSDVTASDLAGAGRTLGLLYSRWGRALESSVGKVCNVVGAVIEIADSDFLDSNPWLLIRSRISVVMDPTPLLTKSCGSTLMVHEW